MTLQRWVADISKDDKTRFSPLCSTCIYNSVAAGESRDITERRRLCNNGLQYTYVINMGLAFAVQALYDPCLKFSSIYGRDILSEGKCYVETSPCQVAWQWQSAFT